MMKSPTKKRILFLTLFLFPFMGKSQVNVPSEVTIDRNGSILNGRIFLSEGPGSFPAEVLLHGFPGNESDVLGISEVLAWSGINALTFNYSGTFKSGGEVSFGEVFILPLYRALKASGENKINILAFQDDHCFRHSRPELAQAVSGWLKEISAGE